MAVLSSQAQTEVRFNWIIDRRSDLIWYIGSAIVGWFYIAVILLLGSRVTDNPMTDVLGVVRLGGIEILITLKLLVILSWAYLIDSPHVFATLARTFFDPEEREVRGKYLRRSWLWFLFGPVFIIVPYLLGALLAPAGITLSPFWLNFGWLVYFVFFRLWAYYHVVRQHWGFFSLYKRRNNDFDDPRENRIDSWAFNLSLYLPLLLFMTSTFYSQTPGFPDLGLRAPLIGDFSIGALIYPLALALYGATLTAYFGWQVYRWRMGRHINGPKLLLLLGILPLHFVAFSHPLLVVFLVPLVTVGHNIQYHRIVWTYGHNKYKQEERPGFAFARRMFTSLPLYVLVGLIFTFALYQGPWIDFLKATTGLQLDTTLLNGISMMAGVADPADLGLGEKLFAALLTGWAMQHYYLDAKIWRVRRDKTLRDNLNVA
jgi:hypothetical protein